MQVGSDSEEYRAVLSVEPLITGVDFDALIVDNAFDNDALRATLNDRGAPAVIPAKTDRKTPIPHDAVSSICSTTAARQIGESRKWDNALFSSGVERRLCFDGSRGRESG